MQKGFFGNMFDTNGDGALTGSERQADLSALAVNIAHDSQTKDEAARKLGAMGINIDDNSIADLHAIIEKNL